jgi:hypothetical protein
MSKSSNKRNSKRSFPADEIAITISQAILADLDAGPQMYGPLPEHLEYYRNSQKTALMKKFKKSGSQEKELRELTFRKFWGVNNHMADFSGEDFSHLGSRHLSKCVNSRERVLKRAKAIVHFVLSDFTFDDLCHAAKHGPGTSLGVSFSNSTVERKFTFPITGTRSAIQLFDLALSHDTLLRDSIQELNGGNISQKYEERDGSDATTVPKNDTIDRMIAIEPTANMYFQQGLMTLMYDRMNGVGLSVETLPETHKTRAREASISGNEATIDFSSASDCVSTGLLQWLLPKKWYWYCDKLRCKTMSIEGRACNLNMFSTMGNATTFPLETLVFWSIAHACRLERVKKQTLLPEWEDLMSVSVFGDDCIVDTRDAPLFMEMATSVGFLVNKEKSFYDPKPGFRESCGGDYLRGYDVRPFYMKAPHNTNISSLEPWLNIILNRVIPKYIMYFGRLEYIYSKNFFRVMVELFKKFGLSLRLVPPYYPDDSGLKISCDFERLRENYSFKFSPILSNQHGSISFAYCRFNYRSEYLRHDFITYAQWLRHPSITAYSIRGNDRNEALNHMWVKTKKIGGYVVAKGISAHWTLPMDRRIR